LALTALLLSLAGCGLENIPILSQPGFIGYGTGEIFHFQNGPPGGDAGFQGYEIYYKLYHIGEFIDINISTIDELKLKFRRLTAFGTAVLPSPLVPIAAADLSTSFEIVIDFSGHLVVDYLTRPQIYSLNNSPGSPSSPISILAFRRGVNYSGSSETKLFKDFAENDEDISPTIWADLNTSGAKVAIALYVISYGVDPTFGALYSIPLYIGDIQLDLPPY
jgi:hypothetical protein